MMLFADLRHSVALWICPELRGTSIVPPKGGMPAEAVVGTEALALLNQRTIILTLLNATCAHLNLSHWAISMRIFGKGDFFRNMLEGADCRTRTAERLMTWFSDNWPDDLQWPRHIARPSKSKRAA